MSKEQGVSPEHETHADSASASNPVQSEPLSSFYVPPWVAIAFGIVALLATGVIISNIAPPLSDLLLSSDEDIPIPDGVRLISEGDEPDYASKDWYYASDLTGCEVAQFYLAQGANCRVQPFVCDQNFVQTELSDTNFFNVATCSRAENDTISGSGWQVIISSGYQDGEQTRFRVYLFD